MPNSEPMLRIFPYGSRQKRMENFKALVEFLEKWKKTNPDLDKSQQIAERFCNVHMHYGYVTRNDIVEQALMKCDLI